MPALEAQKQQKKTTAVASSRGGPRLGMQTQQLLFGLRPNKYSKQCRPLAFECHRPVCMAVPCNHSETISRRFTNSEPFKKLLISNRWYPQSLLRVLSSPPFTAHGVRVENDQLRHKTPHPRCRQCVGSWGWLHGSSGRPRPFPGLGIGAGRAIQWLRCTTCASMASMIQMITAPVCSAEKGTVWSDSDAPVVRQWAGFQVVRSMSGDKPLTTSLTGSWQLQAECRDRLTRWMGLRALKRKIDPSNLPKIWTGVWEGETAVMRCMDHDANKTR